MRKLAGRCASVTGIDRNGPILDQARGHPGNPANASYVEGDFLEYPFDEGSFDFVGANTSLHHMDFGAALGKMAGLLRPGGRLAVVGIARHASPADWAFDAAGIPVNRYYKLTRGEVDPGAPIREPDMSWAQARRAAVRALPGARYQRHLLWRYSLRWSSPARRRRLGIGAPDGAQGVADLAEGGLGAGGVEHRRDQVGVACGPRRAARPARLVHRRLVAGRPARGELARRWSRSTSWQTRRISSGCRRPCRCGS